ncbi:FAD-binding oxidoreductase, partial [Dietzia kunjamensis]|nr:FAD-binding oxidoreductase [Dietzia kunjamensis]
LTTALEAFGPPALVMCHISHVYPTGASRYFTVVAGQRGPDPVAQWRDAKRAASEAIGAAGGSITHHPAV